MKLIAQRVVRPRYQASGINAYCYQHPGVTWLDEPPVGLGRGKLTGRLIEVDPPAGKRAFQNDIIREMLARGVPHWCRLTRWLCG